MLRVHELALRGDADALHVEVLRKPHELNCATPAEAWTALHCAAKNGHKQCCLVLLAQPGVRVDERDMDGRTALGLACYNGHRDVAMLLRMNGACAQQKDLIGLTARSWQIIEHTGQQHQREAGSSSSSSSSAPVDL